MLPLCLLVHKSLLWHTPEYISDLRTSVANIPGRSTLTRFIVWQPRRAADTSTNWRQSLFCCCTASMEQATDRAETAAIDGLLLSWSENIFVSFCLRASEYGLTLWCALGLLVGGAYKCLSYSYSYTGTTIKLWYRSHAIGLAQPISTIELCLWLHYFRACEWMS